MNRRHFLATSTVALAGAFAGCTTGTGGNEQDTTAPPTTESDPDTTAMDGTTGSAGGTMDPSAGPTVAVRSTDEYGDVLVDSEGMSLYLFTTDEEHTSNCYGTCAENWPPLVVDGEPTAGDGVSASLDTTERDDGSMQVTAEGWPLYYYVGDSEPGDTTGQGVSDVWYLLAPDGEQIGGASATTTGGGGPGGGY